MDSVPDIENVIIKLESSLPVCRVCLDNCLEYIEFDGALCAVNGQEITYSDGFKELTSSFSDVPDNTPTKFCVNCGKDLLSAYLFLKRVENANFVLSQAKLFYEASSKCVDEDEEYLLNVEFDDCSENLKIEIDPEQYARIKQECPKESSNHNVDPLEIHIQHNIQIKATDNKLNSPIPPMFDNTGKKSVDESSTETFPHDEGLNWTRDEYARLNESKNGLTEQRKLIYNLKAKCFTQTNYSAEKGVNKCTFGKGKSQSVPDFLDHLNVHSGATPYSCNICLHNFHTKRNLQLHKWRAHSGKRKKSKRINSPVKEYVDEETGKKKFICSICEKHFNSKCGLRAHALSHKRTEFVCHICNKICLTQSTLKKHIGFIHLTDRMKYQCEDCGLVFQYPSHLKDHQRKHDTSNRFKCTHCDRTFCRKLPLEIHMRYHNNDFRYKCDQCDKCYVIKSNLLDHIKTKHTQITFDCDKCDQKFKSMTGLRKHKFTHTGYPYTCPMCSMGQTSRSRMKAHLSGVHKDAVTEEEFNSMFPVIFPKTGYRRPKNVKS